MLYIGIDLGTSACKFLLTDEKGSILNIVSEEYPLEFPQPGWSQQNPEDWWSAVVKGIPKLLDGFDAGKVAGIGCGGQMPRLHESWECVGTLTQKAADALGLTTSVKACARALTSVKETTVPGPALMDAYEAKYQVWKKLYPALKGIL